MLTTSTLILGREDMIESEKNKNILLIDFFDFKISIKKPILEYSIVLFIDDNNQTKILKNRYGDKGNGMFNGIIENIFYKIFNELLTIQQK